MTFSVRLVRTLTFSGALFGGIFLSSNAAQARRGLAAYHLHTSAYVTAARYEPRGSLLNVMNPRTGRSILVRVNDRGPYNGNRILDLSTGAFKALFGSLKRGTGPISYQVVSRGSESSGRSRRARSRSRRYRTSYRR